MSWRIDPKNACLLVVDMQEKLMPVIHDHENLISQAKTAIQGCSLLGLPIYITEQYPKGLGKTLPKIMDCAPDAKVYEKTEFSAGEVIDQISEEDVIMIGIESHVCVRQSIFDFDEAGKRVTLLADVTSSRNPTNKELALDEIRMAGIPACSLEATLFEMMVHSKHPQFKEVSKLIK